jgi:hypothetical protein
MIVVGCKVGLGSKLAVFYIRHSSQFISLSEATDVVRACIDPSDEAALPVHGGLVESLRIRRHKLNRAEADADAQLAERFGRATKLAYGLGWDVTVWVEVLT